MLFIDQNLPFASLGRSGLIPDRYYGRSPYCLVMAVDRV